MGQKIAVKEYGETSLPRIGLYLSTSETKGYGTYLKGYQHLTAAVIQIAEDGSPRNLRETQPLCDVEVRAQMDDQSKTFYGFETRVYASTYPWIDARRAALMSKTLSTIEKRLEIIAAKYGFSPDLATNLLRLADVIGADAFIVKARGNSSTYSENEWRELDATSAQSWINEREREAYVALHPVEVEQS
jgi:hypothetical protein